MRKRRFIALLAVLVLVTGTVGLASLWSHRADGKGRSDRGPDTTEAATLQAAVSPGGAVALEEALVSTADTVVDSVVSIEVEVPVQSQVLTLQEGWPFSDPFSDPFGDPFDLFRKFRQRQSPREQPAPEKTPEQLRKAGGSGVIHSADGYVVTNNHVVEDARTIRVTLHDGRVYDAEVVGTDAESDLAVVKIDETGLPAVRYADVEGIRPGQFAIAVGMPFSLDYSVTVGHVSALGRGGLRPGSSNPFQQKDSSSSLSIQNFIQADTAINPGNSGGPLVNLRGEVMGINSIVHGGIGGGFGFAIPADIVQQVASQLIEHGQVSRAWIGLAMTDLTYEKAQAFGLDRNDGALVEEVYPDSPAEKAKMRRGDVIVSVDSEEVKSANDVVYRVSSHMAGEEVEIDYLRDGKSKTIRLQTGERRDGLAAALGSDGDEDESDEGEDGYGMSLEAVDEQINRQLGRSGNAGGVLVRSVVPSGPANRAGISPGDVIIDVDGRAVDSPAEVERSLDRASKNYVPLTVERDGRQRFVALKSEKED